VGYLRIIRPVNCLITLISVMVGAWIGKSIVVSGQLLAAALIGFCVCAFGNTVNDIKDIDIDRINNPARPLPAGEVNINRASLLAIALFFIPAAGSFFLGLWSFLTVITALFFLFL
jgi:geranylgeranylglycerol-phosphate geranylgeranyltransferase